MDHNVVADQADLVATLHAAIGDHTAGNLAHLGDVEDFQDLRVAHEGSLSTLKRFKDEVKEVQSGQECGMAFEKYEDMRAGDVIECFRVEKVERKLA